MKPVSLVLFACACAFASTGVVLDDFNDSYKGQTLFGWRLGSAAKAGYWYGYDDWNHGKAGLGTTMIPDVVHSDTNFQRTVADDCGEGSPCLHVQFIGGTGYAYPFAGVGFNFLTEGKDVDLTTMDSITFRAKGKGSFRFKLMTKHITDDFDRKNYWADMGRTFRLTPSWRAYRLAVADILPQDGAPLADTATWQECMDHTRKIHLATSETFKARDTLDLWLDDLVMHGVTPTVFGGSWKEDSVASVAGSRDHLSEYVKIANSSLLWDPRQVESIEILSQDGRSVRTIGGTAGAFLLRNLPGGVWIVRAGLATGRQRSGVLANPR